MSHDKSAPEGDDTWHELVATDPLADFFVGVEEQKNISSSYGSEGGLRGGQRLGREMAELLAFWVGDEEYAIDILEIQELIKLPVITPVPRAPEAVLGIISLRGTIVPVLDLSRVLKLGARPVSRTTRVLVLRGDGEPVGLMVDRVTSVVRIERESIEVVPRTMQTEAGDMLSGVGRLDERLLIVLDLVAILSVLENAK